MDKATLTAERARELLDYDPETGVFRWKISRIRVKAGDVAGTLDSKGYVQIRLDYKKYGAHRLAWLMTYGEFPNVDIDHINCDPEDNRISNLRKATRSQNKANVSKPRSNTSGLKGVYRNKAKDCWQAQIKIRGSAKYLGRYACPTAGHIAYCKAAKEHFGEYARTD